MKTQRLASPLSEISLDGKKGRQTIHFVFREDSSRLDLLAKIGKIPSRPRIATFHFLVLVTIKTEGRGIENFSLFHPCHIYISTSSI